VDCGWATEFADFWDASDPDPWECQPGGAANEAIADFLQAGVEPSQLNMGTPFMDTFTTM